MTLVLYLPFLVELDFGNVGFMWGEGKTEVPGEKPLWAKERTSNKLNPHTMYGIDAGIWTRATLVEGECSHHCATLAPAPLTTINPFTARVFDEFCKVTLTFESVDKILWCDHSNESSLPLLSHDAICFSQFWKTKLGNLVKTYLWPHLAVKGLNHNIEHNTCSIQP